MSFIVSGITDCIPGGRNSAALCAAGKAMLAKLGVAGCNGAACVHREFISADAVRVLSQTTFAALLPLFLSTGIFKTVTAYGLQRSSMSVPLFAVFHSFLLFWISKHWLLPLFRIDCDVPFIFSESLFRHQSGMLAKCKANISLYLVGVTPFFWSLGFAVLVRGKKVEMTTRRECWRGWNDSSLHQLSESWPGWYKPYLRYSHSDLATHRNRPPPWESFMIAFNTLVKQPTLLPCWCGLFSRHECCEQEHCHHRSCYRLGQKVHLTVDLCFNRSLSCLPWYYGASGAVHKICIFFLITLHIISINRDVDI